MSEIVLADANPEKRLFISLLTRDIPMVAAFLDLIDNSINAALEPIADKLTTADGYVDILNDNSIQPDVDIRVSFSTEFVKIVDTASGISLATAQQHVFKFGRSQEEENASDRLSVYGLGLKRAIFKLGRRISIISDHIDGGFLLDLDVVKWAADSSLPWQFDLLPREKAQPEECVRKLWCLISMRRR